MSSTQKSVPFPSRRNLSLSLAAAVALVLGSQGAQADILTWDANTGTTGVQDGVGTWSTTGNNWWNGTGNVSWNTGTLNSVIFGGGTGAAGTVTLGSDITVGNITFNAGGYSIAGGGYTLILSNTTIGGTANATISANLAGTTGLTITNNHSSGILLTGNNTYTGATIVGTGTNNGGVAGVAAVLRVGSVGALGNSTDIRVGNGAVLVVAVPNATSILTGSGKTLTLFGTGPGSLGALQGTSGASNTWAGNVVIGGGGSRISGGSSSGTLTISGVISEATANSSILFNRIGGATTVLNAVNTYTGDTQIFNNSGTTTSTLKIGVDNAINANSRLTTIGAASTANAVVDLNGHVQTFRGMDTGASPGAANSAFLIVKNNGATASTLTVGDSTTGSRYVFGGAIQNGTSEMSLVKAGINTQVLTGINTYTGSTTINGGTLQVGAPTPTSGNVHYTGSNGSLASTDIRLNSGSFVVDNTGNSNNSGTRLSDAANLTLNTGTFTYKGSELASTNSSETIGSFTLASGLSTLDIQAGTGNTATLTVDHLSRSTGGGIALIKGTNLGQDISGSVGRLLLTNAPQLVGGGVGTTDAGIVPYLLGTTNGATPDTFVTYNSTTGLRPLSTAEFESGIVAGANVRIASDTPSIPTTTINSLIVTGVNLTLSGTLTNTSGAFLFTTGTSNIGGGTLALGDAEAIMTVSGTTTVIGSKITGTNGLSLFGPGTLGLGSNSSTYTGQTMLHSGIIVPQISSIGSGESLTGPFGRSTVVFAGSQLRSGSAISATPITIGNPITLQADTNIISGGGSDLVFSGPVTLAGGTRTLTNFTDKNTTFSGSIGGNQGDGLTVAGTGSGSVILSGTNSYTGPTMVRSSTLNVSGSIASSSAIAVQNSGSFILSGNNPAGFDRIGDNAPVTLGGGTGNSATFKVDNSTASASFDESVGALTLLNNSILDLGTGDFGTHLHFADSSSNAWTGNLSILNWTQGTDRLYFGSNQSSLTSTQLSQIYFYDASGTSYIQGGMLLEGGELVPVPEPSTIFCGAAMLGLVGWRERRRFSRKAALES